LKHHRASLFRIFGVVVTLLGPVSGAASSQSQADQSGAARDSQIGCGNAAVVLNSQWDRIRSDARTILPLLESEYACNEREGARHLAAALNEHSGDRAWWEAIFRGGQISSAANDFETAETLFKSIQKSYANQAALYFELGTVQLQAGKFAGAKESYERAARLDHSSAEIQLGLAGARALSGYGEDALSGLDQAIQHFPNDSRFLVAYADVLQQLPEYSDSVYQIRAKRYLERAISADASSARAHYLLGQLLIAESNFEEAIRELEIAVRYEPGFKEVHFALSRAYRRVGRAADADEQFSLFRKLESAQTAASGTAVP